MTKRIISGVLSLALVVYSFAPVALATSATISGNGSFSENEVELEHETEAVVVQENSAHIVNDVDADIDTGHNDANDNTGGDVTIITGNGTADVTLRTAVNLNEAVIELPSFEDIEATIEGNGSFSDNEVEFETEDDIEIYQDNRARVHNNVDVDIETGYNDANRNTGGDVAIVSGHADAIVDITNAANANLAHVGSGDSMVDTVVDISGNGSDSENEVELESERDILVVQDNSAHIRNRVDADLDTGHNDANDNTDGSVLIDTGNATVGQLVDGEMLPGIAITNMANLNVAEVDGAVVFGSEYTIDGNGSFSENEIEIESEADLEVFQLCGDEPHTAGLLSLLGGNHRFRDRCLDINNRLDADPDTGHNDLNRNTDADVALISGHATSTEDIVNEGNVNLFGTGVDFDFEFDVEEILDMFL